MTTSRILRNISQFTNWALGDSPLDRRSVFLQASRLVKLDGLGHPIGSVSKANLEWVAVNRPSSIDVCVGTLIFGS